MAYSSIDSKAASAADSLDRSLVKTSLILLTGAMAALLDTTMVSVALPELSRELGASPATLQLVSTAYLLAMAVAVPLVGWLAERLGTRAAWMLALGVFLAGSLLCGAAWSAGSLVAFRALQGAGGGLILPLMQAILAQAAGPQRFGRAMSLVAIPGQLAPILGPVLGGAIATGAILAPQGLGTMIAIALAGRWSDRAGPRPVVIAGMSATALATLALVHPVVASERALLALALFARGAGLGAAGIPIMAAAYHGLETREYARATAGVNVMQRLGASFGTALLAVALQRGLASTNTGPGAGYAAAAAFRGPFLWAVAFAALALLPALTLPRRQQVKEEREVDRDASRDL